MKYYIWTKIKEITGIVEVDEINFWGWLCNITDNNHKIETMEDRPHKKRLIYFYIEEKEEKTAIGYIEVEEEIRIEKVRKEVRNMLERIKDEE